MAFGVTKSELTSWKIKVKNSEIAFLTHYWLDERFPDSFTVTKVGCSDIGKLQAWGDKFDLHPSWIHRDPRFPHFDLFGELQKEVLRKEGKWDQINKFELCADKDPDE